MDFNVIIDSKGDNNTSCNYKSNIKDRGFGGGSTEWTSILINVMYNIMSIHVSTYSIELIIN